MRLTKKIIASALAVCLGAAVSAAPAFATSLRVEPNPYKISISAGSGEFIGLKEIREVPAGEPINLSAYVDEANIILPDEKYYVKGLRLAGHDYGEEGLQVENLYFPVNEDAQYVVAYGLKKDQVAYTVNYVDAAGNQIAESQTFYGNPGDKPVVAFRYIDGYLPTAYNLTRTLVAGQSNEFTFTYNAAPGVVYETVTVPAAGAGDAGAAVAPAGAAAVADAAAAGTIIGDDGTPLAAPEDIVDLDDNETPLASGATTEAAPAEDGGNAMLYIILGCAAVLVVALLAALIMRSRKASQTK